VSHFGRARVRCEACGKIRNGANDHAAFGKTGSLDDFPAGAGSGRAARFIRAFDSALSPAVTTVAT
jgi:hypothetical protein